MAEFAALQTPIRIGSQMLRNRVVASAASVRLADGGLPGRRLQAYYDARAKGSASMIVTETLAVYPQSALGAATGLTLWHDGAPAAYAAMAQRLHNLGTVVVAQLGHAGSQFNGEALNRPSIAPSALAWAPGGDVPRAIETAAVPRWVRYFADAAGHAVRCGFDGIEVHAAHGYLVHEFLSPYLNQRTDGYGGSVSNRARFLVEILHAVRAAIGSEPVVGVRISGDEFTGDDGVTLQQQVETARFLSATQCLDYLAVSAGSYRTIERIVPSAHYPEALHAELSSALRDAVSPIPVILSGRIVHPAVADKLVRTGVCDLVGLTRALIADAGFLAKATRAEPVRSCVGLNDCWRRGLQGMPLGCTVNPEFGAELSVAAAVTRRANGRAARPRRAVVVGAGPAGLEAAYRLASKDFEVTVFERSLQIGGLLRVAMRSRGLESLADMCAYYEVALAAMPVELRLGTVADGETVSACDPDVVLLAIGGVHRVPPHAASDGAYDVAAALQQDSIGPEVVVYSEGRMFEALSVAETLAAQGCHITLATPHPQIGPRLEPGMQRTLGKRLHDLGVEITCQVGFVRWDGEKLYTRSVFGGDDETTGTAWHGDAFVYDFGRLARKDPGLDEIRGSPSVIRIGDCLSPRGIQAALADAYRETERL
jgi:2,4-dienoyl-CoA reductase-like NADH-dependent reductase (Old Yellow Enzyme family)